MNYILLLLLFLYSCSTTQFDPSYLKPKEDPALESRLSKCLNENSLCVAYRNYLVAHSKEKKLKELDINLCRKNKNYCQTYNSYNDIITAGHDNVMKTYKKKCSSGDDRACLAIDILRKSKKDISTRTLVKKLRVLCLKSYNGHVCMNYINFKRVSLGDDKFFDTWQASESVLRKSCEKYKQETACGYLSNTYQELKRASKYKKYAKKACDLGNDRYCDFLEKTERLSKLDKSNIEKLINVIRKDCEDFTNTDYTSCLGLTSIEKRRNNINLENRYYSFACLKGAGGACYDNGRWFERRGQKDIAISYYKMACNHGDIKSCFKLKTIAIDTDKNAKKWIQNQCDFGFAPACIYIGARLASKNKMEEGITYIKKACDLDNAEACWYLGKYNEDKGPLSSVTTYEPHYRKSCEKGYSQGCFSQCITNAKLQKRKTAISSYLKGCQILGNQPNFCSNAKDIEESQASLELDEVRTNCYQRVKGEWIKYVAVGVLAGLGVSVAN